MRTGHTQNFSGFLARKTHFLAAEATIDQCSRKTPSTARSSAGLISLECATVTANSGPSSFVFPEREEILQRREIRKHIVVMPDVSLQQPGTIRTAIDDFRCCQSVA